MPAPRFVLSLESSDLVLEGTAGGAVSGDALGDPECPVHTTALPSHVVRVDDAIPMLVVFAEAPADTVLVVRMATGEVLCNDDGPAYPNPQIVTAAPPGRYEIWVGTFAVGASTPYRLTLSTRTLGEAPVAMSSTGTVGAFPGVPIDCGMALPDYGPIRIGMSVVLGVHTGWTGPNGHGTFVTNDTWWNDLMWPFVGQRTEVTEIAGLDPAGCPYVRVALDSGAWGWRIRNLSP